MLETSSSNSLRTDVTSFVLVVRACLFRTASLHWNGIQTVIRNWYEQNVEMNMKACSVNTASAHISKHMGWTHRQNAPRHNIHLHMQIANQAQIQNLIFKQIVQFYMSSTFSFSPRLFGSLCMLLDLYQHTAKCAIAHVCQRFKSQGLKASKHPSGG